MNSDYIEIRTLLYRALSQVLHCACCYDEWKAAEWISSAAVKLDILITEDYQPTPGLERAYIDWLIKNGENATNNLRRLRKSLYLEAVDRSKNKKEAAKLLGINRTTLMQHLSVSRNKK